MSISERVKKTCKTADWVERNFRILGLPNENGSEFISEPVRVRAKQIKFLDHQRKTKYLRTFLNANFLNGKSKSEIDKNLEHPIKTNIFDNKFHFLSCSDSALFAGKTLISEMDRARVKGTNF